jgi:aspartate aminotransferase
MKVSRKLDAIKESATVRIADLAREISSSGVDVISFSLGEPDFPTPLHICEAASEAVKQGKTHYTPSAGIPELREAIAEKLRNENGMDVTKKNILVTPGAKHAIYETCLSILEEGDEAILFDPAWVTLDACVRMCGGITRWIRSVEEAQEAISKKTKLIILNSPNNPSGYVLSKDELSTIADLVVDHDLWVLSDEIYEKIIYDAKHFSIASFPGMLDRTITINGFSKAYAMTGWRLGYACAPPSIFKSMLKIQQHTATCAPSFAQWGGLAALTGPQQCVEDMVREFRRRRDLLVGKLNRIGLRCALPEGAFYLFLDVSSIGTGMEVSELLLKKGVAVTPGEDFGPSGKNFIRISYAAAYEKIEEGIGRIEEAIRSLPSR